MNAASIILVLKALLVILPEVVALVRDGKINSDAREEVLNALNTRWDARIKAAVDAGNKEPVDESVDPYNRTK